MKKYTSFVAFGFLALALVLSTSNVLAQDAVETTEEAVVSTEEAIVEEAEAPVPTLISEEVEELMDEEVMEEEEDTVKRKKIRNGDKALNTLDAYMYSISRVQNLSGRLSNKLNEMEKSDIAVGSYRNKMREVNNLIRNSFGPIKKIKQNLPAIVDSGYYNEGFIEETQASLNLGSKNALSAQKAMLEIVESLIALEQ